MNSKNKMLFGFALTVSATACFGQSAWLPARQEIKVTPGFTFSTFDEFWGGPGGRTKLDPLNANDESLDQYTGFVALEYGILDNLAADATVAYSATTETMALGEGDEGLADTLIGMRYRLMDENNAPCPFAPTVALRVGGIIPGTYDRNQAFSVGDGAYGFESSLLLGKAFGETGFGMYGDIGYRIRENPVPHDLFGSVGVFQQIGPATVNFGYRHVQSLSGIDIMGAGFNPPAGPASGFPALKEINQLIEGGVSFTDNGGRVYQVSVAKSIDGRNTGDKFIIGVNATFSF
jgi:hypothetical protein